MAVSRLKQLDRIAVLGWGNPSRGDDGLGPALVDLLERAWHAHPDWPDLSLVTAHQLQPEHVLALQDRDAALFIDAAAGQREPYVFRSVRPAADLAGNSHALGPAALLRAYEQAFGTPPPPAFSLEVGGSEFGLDRPLSKRAVDNLSAALDFLNSALNQRSRNAWLAFTEPINRRGS